VSDKAGFERGCCAVNAVVALIKSASERRSGKI